MYREGMGADLVRACCRPVGAAVLLWLLCAGQASAALHLRSCRFLPACLTLLRRLRADPRVPRRAKLAMLAAGLWVLSPIDLIPEFLPVIGPLDDVVVAALALRYAARQVPPEVLYAAWLAEPRLLARLIGQPAEVQVE